MEGKAVLFKKLADIDAFDIEVNTESIKEFIRTVELISPTFGGINLEDIKAPECFQIERELKKSLDIPVFHDDQHGTAVVVTAGLLNALEIQNKNIEKVKIVCLGAGAAGLATLNLLVRMGLPKANVTILDSQGVIHMERKKLCPFKMLFAKHTQMRKLDEVIDGTDVFIGLAGPDLLTVSQLKRMALNPIVFALSNPEPEINRDLALQARNDLIIATGRSDYPNQINNVICFPYIFRGALDVRATDISTGMCIGAVKAIQELTKQTVPQCIIDLYPDVNTLSFGPNYILPKPMDHRLKKCVSETISRIAIEEGLAQNL
jgi:malic enzyme